MSSTDYFRGKSGILSESTIRHALIEPELMQKVGWGRGHVGIFSA